MRGEENAPTQTIFRRKCFRDGLRRCNLPLIGIFLLAFLLRMIQLHARPLWYDEAFAILYASLSPAKMIYGTVTPVTGAGAADVHPLLYYFTLHGCMGVVGPSPLAARFLSVSLGMLTVALLWRMADWFFDRRTGMVRPTRASLPRPKRRRCSAGWTRLDWPRRG